MTAQTELDQTERVILQAAEDAGEPGSPRDLIVIDDTTGGLTAAALAQVADHAEGAVWSWSASRAGTTALAERFEDAVTAGRLRLPTDPDPVALEEFAASADVHLVLMRLPKALQGLDDHARRLAALAHATGREDLTVIAGARVKHMTRTQNEVLAASFTEVRASRGIGKSRALIASTPRPDAPAPAPATGIARLQVQGGEREFSLRGIGSVFSGGRGDAGSLLLLEALDRSATAGEVTAERVIDLGCGNGLMTAYLAAAFPEASVLGSDDEADAVASTRATLEASALARPEVTVAWDSSLSREADRSADLIVLNPPFHDGTVVDATLVQGLLDAADRVLRPGGQLWFVHNSHLRYRPEVEARIGPARQQARDRRFTVLSATKG